MKRGKLHESILKWRTDKYRKALWHHCNEAGLLLTLITSIMVILSCSSPLYNDALIDDLSFERELRISPELGYGTDQGQLRTYRRCVNFKESTRSLAFEGRDYQETSITSRRQLNEALSVNTKAAITGMFGEALASVNSFQSVDFIDENFYWLVYAKYDLSIKNIDTGSPEFSLTPQAKEILEKHGVEGFYKACGTQFYSGHRLGARYGLLYEFSAQEGKTTNRLKASASYENMGINAAAQFEQVLSLAAKSETLKIHSYTQGGGAGLSEDAKSPSDLKNTFLAFKLQVQRRHVLLKELMPQLGSARQVFFEHGYLVPIHLPADV